MKTFGLIGKNIDYSFSRKYFAEKFSKEGINAEYLNFDIKSIAEFPGILQNQNVHGFNVTIPYKESIIPYLDELDENAEKIQAVNTIKVTEKGTLKGYNTDYWGFQKSLEPYLESFHNSALILGTGGASKAVAFALDILAVDHHFVSRKPGPGQINYDELSREIINHKKLIINTTPLGTFPNTDQHPNLPFEYLTEEHLIFDLIYNPSETTLMKLASARGAKCLNGRRMLELQAEKAWATWNS